MRRRVGPWKTRADAVRSNWKDPRGKRVPRHLKWHQKPEGTYAINSRIGRIENDAEKVSRMLGALREKEWEIKFTVAACSPHGYAYQADGLTGDEAFLKAFRLWRGDVSALAAKIPRFAAPLTLARPIGANRRRKRQYYLAQKREKLITKIKHLGFLLKRVYAEAQHLAPPPPPSVAPKRTWTRRNIKVRSTREYNRLYNRLYMRQYRESREPRLPDLPSTSPDPSGIMRASWQKPVTKKLVAA